MVVADIKNKVQEGGKYNKKLKKAANKLFKKHGWLIASCAFVFVSIAANSPCTIPYYEPEEPEGLAQFKKFN